MSFVVDAKDSRFCSWSFIVGFVADAKDCMSFVPFTCLALVASILLLVYFGIMELGFC